MFIILPTVVIVALLWRAASDRMDTGKGMVHIEPGASYIYLEDCDIRINGWDSYNVTYFFFPSYAKISSLDYTDTEFKIYSPEGSLLEHPETGKILDVMVGNKMEELTPYKVAFFCSGNLYTVQLEMPDNSLQDIERGIYIPTSIKVISPEGNVEYAEGSAEIKGRGNSSWEFSLKKPYEIRLPSEVSLAGMKASNKWTLLSNQLDKTRMLNKIVFDTSKDIGMEYAIESDWIDLYANGEYVGNYLLCHEPHIGSGDLDIYNLQKANQPYFDEAVPFETGNMKGFIYKENPTEISGGYMIEFSPIYYENKDCGFRSKTGNMFCLKSPDNASKEELELISGFVNRFEQEIYVNNTIDTEYKYLDKYSFARRYLIDEVFYNTDAAFASCFYYKKPRQEKLYAGPCWDYDKACGQNGGIYRDYTGTILDREYTLQWDAEMMANDAYIDYVKGVFADSLNVFDRLVKMGIDEYYERAGASIRMDRTRWNGLESVQYREIDDDIRYLKFFLYNRLQFMKELYDLRTTGSMEPDISNNESHTLTFMYKDGRKEEISVDDGTQITEADMPAHDIGSDGWEIESMKEKLTYYIPIYEDMVMTASGAEPIE